MQFLNVSVVEKYIKVTVYVEDDSFVRESAV
jgi:hypothetical protein